MNKKRVLLVLCLSLIFSVFLISFISAADNSTSNVSTSVTGSFSKAYSCVENQVSDRLSSSSSAMTAEELAFSLLAVSYNSDLQGKLKTKLDELKDTNNACWPKSACTLKDTSLVLLAYNHVGLDVADIKNWLTNQTMAPSDLVWYLEIDTENKSKCTIKYDGTSRAITVDENKIITGSFGSCLRSANSGYWLEVDSSCYGKEFEVSCEESFLVATFYKRRSSSSSAVYYLTSSTESRSPNGVAPAIVRSLCFKQGSSCNYEGSLWAALAVNTKDKSFRDIVIPYLITLSPDNERYLPYSFLYELTDYNEYLSQLITKQSRQGFWRISETSRQYYDTAVALLRLGRMGDSKQATAARNYLLDPSVQTQEGCWNANNLRDTAFLLYVLDPKSAKTITNVKTCSDYSSSGYSCITSAACDKVNGTQQPFSCSSFGTICCSKVAEIEKTCSEKGGTRCSSTEKCTGDSVSAFGTTSCCISGICKLEEVTELSSCEKEGYNCMVQCGPSEDVASFDCSLDSGGVCCAPKPDTTTEESKSYWWLWLLIILIVLLVLAIIFRNQLKMWGFRLKNKFSKSPPSSQMPPRPMSPGRPMPYPQFRPTRVIPGMMPPRPPMPPPGRPMQQPRPPFGKEKELDDTLRKLRDMGK